MIPFTLVVFAVKWREYRAVRWKTRKLLRQVLGLLNGRGLVLWLQRIHEKQFYTA